MEMGTWSGVIRMGASGDECDSSAIGVVQCRVIECEASAMGTEIDGRGFALDEANHDVLPITNMIAELQTEGLVYLITMLIGCSKTDKRSLPYCLRQMSRTENRKHRRCRSLSQHK